MNIQIKEVVAKLTFGIFCLAEPLCRQAGVSEASHL